MPHPAYRAPLISNLTHKNKRLLTFFDTVTHDLLDRTSYKSMGGGQSTSKDTELPQETSRNQGGRDKVKIQRGVIDHDVVSTSSHSDIVSTSSEIAIRRRFQTPAKPLKKEPRQHRVHALQRLPPAEVKRLVQINSGISFASTFDSCERGYTESEPESETREAERSVGSSSSILCINRCTDTSKCVSLCDATKRTKCVCSTPRLVRSPQSKITEVPVVRITPSDSIVSSSTKTVCSNSNVEPIAIVVNEKPSIVTQLPPQSATKSNQSVSVESHSEEVQVNRIDVRKHGNSTNKQQSEITQQDSHVVQSHGQTSSETSTAPEKQQLKYKSSPTQVSFKSPNQTHNAVAICTAPVGPIICKCDPFSNSPCICGLPNTPESSKSSYAIKSKDKCICDIPPITVKYCGSLVNANNKCICCSPKNTSRSVFDLIPRVPCVAGETEVTCLCSTTSTTPCNCGSPQISISSRSVFDASNTTDTCNCDSPIDSLASKSTKESLAKDLCICLPATNQTNGKVICVCDQAGGKCICEPLATETTKNLAPRRPNIYSSSKSSSPSTVLCICDPKTDAPKVREIPQKSKSICVKTTIPCPPSKICKNISEKTKIFCKSEIKTVRDPVPKTPCVSSTTHKSTTSNLIRVCEPDSKELSICSSYDPSTLYICDPTPCLNSSAKNPPKITEVRCTCCTGRGICKCCACTPKKVVKTVDASCLCDSQTRLYLCDKPKFTCICDPEEKTGQIRPSSDSSEGARKRSSSPPSTQFKRSIAKRAQNLKKYACVPVRPCKAKAAVEPIGVISTVVSKLPKYACPKPVLLDVEIFPTMEHPNGMRPNQHKVVVKSYGPAHDKYFENKSAGDVHAHLTRFNSDLDRRPFRKCCNEKCEDTDEWDTYFEPDQNKSHRSRNLMQNRPVTQQNYLPPRLNNISKECNCNCNCCGPIDKRMESSGRTLQNGSQTTPSLFESRGASPVPCECCKCRSHSPTRFRGLNCNSPVHMDRSTNTSQNNLYRTNKHCNRSESAGSCRFACACINKYPPMSPATLPQYDNSERYGPFPHNEYERLNQARICQCDHCLRAAAANGSRTLPRDYDKLPYEKHQKYGDLVNELQHELGSRNATSHARKSNESEEIERSRAKYHEANIWTNKDDCCRSECVLCPQEHCNKGKRSAERKCCNSAECDRHTIERGRVEKNISKFNSNQDCWTLSK